MKVRRMAVYVVVGGTVIAFAFVVLVGMRGTTMKHDRAQFMTLVKLFTVRDVARQVHCSGQDIGDIRSVEELLTIAAEQGICLDEAGMGDLSVDEWGRKVLWSVEKVDADRLIIVRSKGRDGVFDSDNGDDLQLRSWIRGCGPAD